MAIPASATEEVKESAPDAAVELAASGLFNSSSIETTVVLFYSSSVLSSTEFLNNGYTDFLDFHSNRKTFYSAVTTTSYSIIATQLDPDAPPTVRTVADSYYDTVIIPSGGVGIMVQYNGDGESPESVDTAHAHEYNVSESDLELKFFNQDETDSDILAQREASREAYNSTYLDSGGQFAALESRTESYNYQYVGASVDDMETDSLRHVYGWSEDTVSGSVNARIDFLAQDVYSTIPINRFIITKTDGHDLSMENLQPIQSDETAGAGLGGAMLMTGSSAAVVAPVMVSTGMSTGGGGGGGY